MKKALKLSLLLALTLSLSSCDWPWEDDDEDVAVSSGTENAAATYTAPSTTEATASQETATEEATAAAEEEEEAAKTGVTETGTYWGRHNGNRPTFYFWKSMSSYPSTFQVSISGCISNWTVKNNGHRYEGGGYLAKQSDVPGRGLVVVGPASCGGNRATVSY